MSHHPARIAFVAALLAASALAGSCSRSAPRTVVLVTIDTLRADRLGCYGDAEAATPVLDALARRGVRLTSASAPAPVTLPSHASILTGRFPSAHGVRSNGAFTLPADETTLAEILAKDGFRTGAFVGAFVLDDRFGLAQGFDVYDDRFGDGSASPAHGGAADASNRPNARRADAVTSAALAWLQTLPKRAPVFLWAHYWDPHDAYDPPEPFRSRFGDPYRGEIAYTDQEIGRLFEGLDRLGRLDDALVAVVADHGEAFGEHGEMYHGLFVYEPTIHVPAILSWPGRIPEGRTLDDETSLVDVAPTVLSLLGLDRPAAMQGVDLGPAMRGEAKIARPQGVLIENFVPRYEFGWSGLYALRREGTKYILAPREELYDLRSDPREDVNLAAGDASRARGERDRLEAEVARSEESASEMGATAIDEDSIARLRSLGYVAGGAGGSAGAPLDRERPDPKDRVHEYLRLQEAQKALAQGQYVEAVTALEAVLAKDPTIASVQDVLATAHLRAGNPARAEEVWRALLANDPSYCIAMWRLAEVAMVARRDYAAARDGFLRSLACDPAQQEIWVRLAAVESAIGSRDAAREALSKALDLAPDDPTALERLAALDNEAGLTNQAAVLWERLLAVSPRSSAALVGLGGVAFRAGDLDRAEDLLRRAVDADPANPAALANLGVVLIRRERLAEAIAHLDKALALDGSMAKVRFNLAMALIRSGQLDRARAELERYAAAEPSDTRGFATLADALAAAGRHADAEVVRRRVR